MVRCHEGSDAGTGKQGGRNRDTPAPGFSPGPSGIAQCSSAMRLVFMSVMKLLIDSNAAVGQGPS